MDANVELCGVEAKSDVAEMCAQDPYVSAREAQEKVRLWLIEVDKRIKRDMAIEKIFGLDMFQVMKWQNKHGIKREQTPFP